ncbi:cytosine permease [Streptomyces antnestii]|uniref:Cytosine permease n=1 Tax=Streptomyces antnestii TaxID=2494256 RepID=A0A437Q0K4_9ACTN|nr:cytosine permease [Streptomyces sp. San01]RVU27989.1 cytosine permease [Streptomyces sp. San01]
MTTAHRPAAPAKPEGSNPHHSSHAEEYEHEPVPASARRSLMSVAATWFGFPMNLGSAVFGGVIVYNLGLAKGSLAILVGNLVLFCYVGALSHHAGSTGKNFALLTADTFGSRGRNLPAGLLATVVIGWFSFQVGLTGTTLSGSLGWSALGGAAVGGVLYTLLTMAGIRALSLIGMIATPLFLVLTVVALAYGLDAHTTLGDTIGYQGAGTALGFGGAVAIIIAGFADSGTMTADFTRWSKDGRSAVLATLTAFPFANFLANGAGGLIVAVGATANPAKDGGGFLNLLTGHSTLLTGIAIIFVFVNLGSVASHCLYNGAVGWSALTPLRMRSLTVILGTVGVAFALSGVWGYFLNWLNLLGVFVPPIGAVLITDRLLKARTGDRPAGAFRVTALASWAAGAAAAGLAHYTLPELVDPVIGMITAAVVYAAAETVMRRRPTAGRPDPALSA